jgi:hypothetical protein
MGHIFISFLFYNIILFIIYRHYKKGEFFIKKTDLFVYIILFIIFGTYGGGEGDYFHYKELVEEYNSLQDVLFYTGMEKQYTLLSHYVGGNYTLWRLVLFSIQFLGLGFFLYKAKLNTYTVLLSFTSFCLVTSVYGRAFWGAIYFFMGVYLLIEKKNPLYLIAIALCYFSHTSNIVLIALLPLAFINFKKWHVIVIVVVFGSLVALFRDAFTNLINTGGFDAEGAEYFNSRLQNYGNLDTKNYFGKAIGETISIILRDTFVITILFSVISLMFKNQNRYISIYRPVRGVVNITIGLVVLASVILAASIGSAALFYRIFDMTFFPICIILPCLRNSNHIRKKVYDIYIYLFIFYSEYGYLRDLYYAYADGV